MLYWDDIGLYGACGHVGLRDVELLRFHDNFRESGLTLMSLELGVSFQKQSPGGTIDPKPKPETCRQRIPQVAFERRMSWVRLRFRRT